MFHPNVWLHDLCFCNGQCCHLLMFHGFQWTSCDTVRIELDIVTVTELTLDLHPEAGLFGFLFYLFMESTILEIVIKDIILILILSTFLNFGILSLYLDLNNWISSQNLYVFQDAAEKRQPLAQDRESAVPTLLPLLCWWLMGIAFGRVHEGDQNELKQCRLLLAGFFNCWTDIVGSSNRLVQYIYIYIIYLKNRIQVNSWRDFWYVGIR